MENVRGWFIEGERRFGEAEREGEELLLLPFNFLRKWASEI